MIKSVKQTGQVYTPEYIVKNMLDLVDYSSDSILKKHIIDNSCGDGAFLCEIVKRYCSEFLKKYPNQIKELHEDLSKYIHGIEIDAIEHKKCLANLHKTAQEFGLNEISWDVLCEDSLVVSKYENQMDFVVGNPPYVRIHNFSESVKKDNRFSFSQNGMSDLYIIFFELSFNMLNSNGKIALITPSSWLTSKAGSVLRNDILKKRFLSKVIDLGHFQPFSATTYCLISIFENGAKHEKIAFYTYNSERMMPSFSGMLSYSSVLIDGCFYFATEETLIKLKQIQKSYLLKKHKIEVKNGFATLADAVFINNCYTGRGVIDILKGSTGDWTKCLFPYTPTGKPLSWDMVKKEMPNVAEILLKHQDILKKRDIDKEENWFLFGRTQSLNDISVDKIAVNTIVKDFNKIKINFVSAGKGVYSGIYILSPYGFSEIERVLKTEDFIQYIKALGKYKSGGYYTFSSLDLKKFLIHTLEKDLHEEQRLFENIESVI